MLTGFDELQRFLDKRTTIFFRAMHDIYKDRYGDADSKHPIQDMARLLSNTMILADLHGRKRVLMEADAARKKAKFGTERTPISPLPFEEAIEDITSRDPRLAHGYLEVQRLYNEAHVFAMAKAVNSNITKRIQKELENNYKAGRGLAEFEEVWKQITPWTQSYADLVYRTNTSTAFTQGRIAQAKDPDVQEVAPALTFINMHLPDSRPNHEAADGLIAASSDPIWRKFTPPLGYACRCGLNMVTKYELERRGLIKDGKVIPYYPAGFSNAHPDPGFNTGGMSWEGVA